MKTSQITALRPISLCHHAAAVVQAIAHAASRQPDEFGRTAECAEELVERTGAWRVLVDSLADLRMAAADETRFREFVYSLVQRFSRLTHVSHQIPRKPRRARDPSVPDRS